MDLDAIRAFCFSFPRSTENLQWGEELCFKVGGKLFAVVGLGSVPQRITFKCNPEAFAELTEREGIVPAAYVGRYKWVTLERLDILPEEELQEAILHSYQMVATKIKPDRKRITRHKRKSRVA